MAKAAEASSQPLSEDGQEPHPAHVPGRLAEENQESTRINSLAQCESDIHINYDPPNYMSPKQSPNPREDYIKKISPHIDPKEKKDKKSLSSNEKNPQKKKKKKKKKK